MGTVLAFVVALAILIAVHEYGHYRVAVACGVKVLRFSIGFGKPLLRWTSKRDGTEYTVCLLPLGGYVRMLDEREGPVEVSEQHRAFNRQPLRSRALIVAAGPLANLLLAAALYAVVAWTGVPQPLPITATPVANSMADRAGINGGDWIVRAAAADDAPQTVQSFEALRWMLTQAALDQEDLHLWLASGPDAPEREVVLPLSTLPAGEFDSAVLQRIGLVAPYSAPVVEGVLPDGAAMKAGLKTMDLVLQVDGVSVRDAQDLRARIREGVGADGSRRTQTWQIERQGHALDVSVQPQPERREGRWIGRVGAYIGSPPKMIDVSYGPWAGLVEGVRQTWDVAGLSVRTMFKMLVGQVSVKNLSGPLTIADYAGKSASLGWVAYLQFLALISVSLGVLNLMPLPVLDGGHLLYYAWEWLTGRPISDIWMERLQRGGVAILVALMSLAVFNDLARLLG